MSSTDRQNNLLVSEDWQKIYQSFKNADFQSYDFDNLRRTMIEYIRTNFPEDFNDYIESSEYLALIDLIAYVGQSIAFRVDLNARENFLELAERRDSILRLARLIGYNAKRNTAASGLLKFNTVSTTETVIDSNGRNLSGQYITWNDPSNANWYNQFISVINAALPQSHQFGNPIDSATIYNISTAQYRFNTVTSTVSIYDFTKTIAGRSMNFEITSTTFSGQSYIYEEAPKVGNSIACIYSDDGQGAGSPGTGFFFNFTQGTLNTATFTVSNPTANQQIDIATQNINDSDIWLYSLDSKTGLETTLWTQVPSTTGNSVIYNSVNNSVKNIYSVVTRTNDAISLSFGDGIFGNLPQGNFIVYYRTSNGLNYTINTTDMVNILFNIPYVSSSNQSETLTISLSLASSVANSASSETNASVKTNAPQTYYTQNRMITGEDYNINPLSSSLQIAKVKAVNRASSGISRYFDLIDPTGKYSTTNLFGDDGIIYQETYTYSTNFSYVTDLDIQGVIDNTIYEILNAPDLRNFYYANFLDYLSVSVNAAWTSVTTDSNTVSGFINAPGQTIPYVVGSSTATDLKYITPGSLIKFIAPAGQCFNLITNTLMTATINFAGTITGNTLTITNATGTVITGMALSGGTVAAGTYIISGSGTTWIVNKSQTATATTATISADNTANYIWAQVVKVTDDGTAGGSGVLSTGMGPIVLDKVIPTKSVVSQIMPQFNRTLTPSIITAMLDLIKANDNFGLRYDALTTTWQIVYANNLNSSSAFSLANQSDTTLQNLDSSWILLFTSNTVQYTINTRKLRYIFESDAELTFYFDSNVPVYDSTSSSTVLDTVKILSVNSQPDLPTPFTQDLTWQIVSEYYGQDGYIDPKKIVVTFADSTGTGVVDNPQLFADIVSPTTGDGTTKYIVEERYTISSGQEDYRYVSNDPILGPVIVLPSQANASFASYADGTYFYFIDTATVVKLNLSSILKLVPTLDYKVYVGRSKLKFQYVHSADYDSRIDPGSSNIMDVYVLTKNYDIDFRQWLTAGGTPPLPPSSDELHSLLSPNLDLIKSISDEIIYHPVSYKLLFGSDADPSVQATFNVMINPTGTASNSDIKARILTAINTFFSLDNWNFGDSFYFTELSTYVMNQLTPDIINFAIVPTQPGSYFGNLFEIQCPSDQILISSATTDNIVVVSGFTGSNLKTITSQNTNFSNNQSVTSNAYGGNL